MVVVCWILICGGASEPWRRDKHSQVLKLTKVIWPGAKLSKMEAQFYMVNTEVGSEVPMVDRLP